ncbi:hypothetical protein KAR91_40980, partial [Candidatus Pacearchaeota archaeon]|nr:hypothetical protein [Candidatus Pacearchaeota archaeon]
MSCVELPGNVLVQQGFINTVLVSLGKAPAFFIPILIAFWFGLNKTTDAFFLVLSIIMFIVQCFVGSIRPIIIPFISEIKAGAKPSCEFVSNILMLVLICSVLVVLVHIAFSEKLVSLMTKLDENSLSITKAINLRLSPLIVIMACSSLFIGTVQGYKKFYFVAILPAAGSLTVILSGLLLRATMGIEAICAGYIAGQLLILVAALAKAKKLIGGIKLSGYFLTPDTIGFTKTAFFQLLAILVWSINPVVDNVMASHIGVGSISKIGYAYRIISVPIGLISSGVIVVLFAHFSQIYHEQGVARLKNYILRT